MIWWLIGYSMGFWAVGTFIVWVERQRIKKGHKRSKPAGMMFLTAFWPIYMVGGLWMCAVHLMALAVGKQERKCKTAGCSNRVWAAASTCDTCFDKAAREGGP